MTNALLSPVQTGQAVDLAGTLFRKQILPVGKINYKGKDGKEREINFDKKYLSDIAAAFQQKAFDQVAFQLADKDNTHTMDPTRFGGEVQGVEVTDDGLYGTLNLTPETADLVRKNPKLGVSARIIEGLEHSDGRKFDRAMLHVLGTLDPNVTGMKSWEEVNLSREVDVDETLDLTEATYVAGKDNKEIDMGRNGKSGTRAPRQSTDHDVDLTEEELDLVRQVAEEEDKEHEVQLARFQQQDSRISQLEQELADERFVAERDRLIASGVPPAMIELARPVLTMPRSQTIDLTRDGKKETIDFSNVVRALLKEARGTVDLNREDGLFDDDSNPDRKDDEILASWNL